MTFIIYDMRRWGMMTNKAYIRFWGWDMDHF